MEKTNDPIVMENIIVGFNISSLTSGIIALKNREDCMIITDNDVFEYLNLERDCILTEYDCKILDKIKINVNKVPLRDLELKLKDKKELNISTDKLYIANKQDIIRNLLEIYTNLGGEISERTEITGVEGKSVIVNNNYYCEYDKLLITGPNSSITPYINMVKRKQEFKDALNFFIRVKNVEKTKASCKLEIDGPLDYDYLLNNREYTTIGVVYNLESNPYWEIEQDKVIKEIKNRLIDMSNRVNYIDKDEFNKKIKDFETKINEFMNQDIEINLAKDKLQEYFELLSYSPDNVNRTIHFYKDSFLFGSRFGTSNPLTGMGVGYEILSAYDILKDIKNNKLSESNTYKDKLISLNILYRRIFKSLFSKSILNYINNREKFTEYVINNMILNENNEKYSLKEFLKCRKDFKKEIIDGKQQ